MKCKLLLAVLVVTLVISSAFGSGVSSKVRENDRSYYMNPVPINSIWNANFSSIGLDGIHVETLANTPEYLYAGTACDGVYRLNLTNDVLIWEYLGFEGEFVESIYIDPEFPQIIYVGLHVYCQMNNAGAPHSLYKSTDGGIDWISIDTGIEEGDIGGRLTGRKAAHCLNWRLPVLCITGVLGNPQILYATSYGHVFKSTNGGGSWDLIWDNQGCWGYGVHVITVDSSNPEYLWAGGESNMFSAILIKSTDSGSTWSFVAPGMGGDNACYMIAVHPSDSDTVYAGMEGKLAKTTDGGETWSFVLSPSEYPYFRGLVIDPLEPDRIFAGGACNCPSAPLMVWGTNTDGRPWTGQSDEQAEMVRTIVLDSNDSDILYIGTRGTGVYRCSGAWRPYWNEQVE